MSSSVKINLPEPVNDDEVRLALKSILASDEFKRSERLSTFLTYLVDKTLNNETECLKGYALGLDVFNRGEGFNPDTDTIVRVHAVRLRAALAKYYLADGQKAEIQICLPKGGYVPVFRPGTIKSIGKTDEETGTVSPKIFPIGPKVVILPVEDISPGNEFSDQARGLTLQVINDLTRFKNLRVLSMTSALDYRQGENSQDEMFRELGVDYILTLSLMNNGRLVIVSAQLLSTGDMQTLWSDMIEREIEPKNIARILQGISSQIAAVAGSNYGAIAQAEAVRVAKHPETVSDAYKCLLNFFQYVTQKTVDRHVQQKACLEKIVKLHPDTSRAWAMLARIYGDEYRFEYNPVLANEASKRSLRAARRAVDIDPTDSFTLAHLAQSFSEDAQYDLCSEYYEKALKFNPNDTEILAVSALHYANQGDWEMAKMLADRSIELSPKHPNWFRAVPYMIQLRNGEYRNALAEVEPLYEEASPLVDLGRLVAYAKLGRIDEAKQLLKSLDDEFPSYTKNIVEQFKHRYLPKEIALTVQETVDGLR